MFYKVLCFGATLLFISCACAQGVDDIPFLFDEDDRPPVQAPIQPKVEPVIATTAPSKPIKFNKPQSDVPNIGTKAEPLTKLTVTTPPLPEVSIDLTDPQPQPQKPVKPVNTRTQGIDILGNSSWNEVAPSAGGIGYLSDVRGFELEGFYLGMSPEEVLALAHENNYKIVSSKDAISKFRTSYYEDICKKSGARAPEKIRECIAKISRLNDTSYLSTLKIARPKTREYIEFNFSSPATNNRVWRIHYENKGDNSLNFTAANTQKKLDRQEAFFNAVFNKFGYPDDVKNYVWGSENDAYMKVGMYGSNYDAFITLTDAELESEDFTQAHDWLDETKPFEHFGFED